ncbi:hypothetical protein XELAEV_18031609mg [Xenopus laevis]|uniref:Uncharacterized protein n=1 Tax=Xenopus laevis TaxID=8355 RepID=A0A974CMV6_XENLA|nr:hypothetical protein XELAEV_18031609mg [Xenopus laevis]
MAAASPFSSTQSDSGPPDSPVSLHSEMPHESLHVKLTEMSVTITSQLTREIRDLGHRTEEMENKLDGAIIRLNEHDSSITHLATQYEEVVERLEDLENRSRRNNIRIRGLTEDIKDLQVEIPKLLANLVPDIPIAHLASITIQQRRELRPITQLLQQHNILYRWGFPFKLLFTYNSKQHMVKSLKEGQTTLRLLRIASDQSPPDRPHSLPAQTPPSPRSPLATIWEKAPLKSP